MCILTVMNTTVSEASRPPTKSRSGSTARGVTISIATTLGLMVALGAAGTASYLAGVGGYGPLGWAMVPIALLIAGLLSARHAWRHVGFRRPVLRTTAGMLGILFSTLLVAGVIGTSSGVGVPWVAIPGWLGLAVVVGFVEETIYRGILPRLFPSGRPVLAVVVPTLAFTLAHSVTAVSPDQSAGGLVRLIVFALGFGVVAAMLTRLTASVYPAIMLHVAFDAAGFTLAATNQVVTDLISIAVVIVGAVVLTTLAVRRPTP